ncbi:MAG TPA: 30S ribosomal protein S19 [Elusimicrobiota bacterium]|nr:30S ribosomal protein S19 [Elusimicrobiota bacterium]
MSRSTSKGPYVDQRLLGKIQKMKQSGEKKVIKTWARASMITPDFVGFTLAIHNGKKFLPVFVSDQMVGHRVGEFAPTRFFKGHGAAHTKEATALT